LSADIGVDPVFTAGRPFFFWFFQDTCLFYYFRAEPDAGESAQGPACIMQLSQGITPRHLGKIRLRYKLENILKIHFFIMRILYFGQSYSIYKDF